MGKLGVIFYYREMPAMNRESSDFRRFIDSAFGTQRMETQAVNSAGYLMPYVTFIRSHICSADWVLTNVCQFPRLAYRGS